MAENVDNLVENLKQIKRTEGRESYKRAWNQLTREQQKLVVAKINGSSPGPIFGETGEGANSHRTSASPRLLSGEQNLGSISTNKITFYATTSRVLRHQRTFLTEKLDDVSYSHISSTSLEHRPNNNLLTLGASISILGILPLMLGAFLSASNWVLWGFFLMIIGVLVVVIAFLYNTSFWQIRVVGLSPRELRSWQLRGGNREQTEGFARLVQDQIRPRAVVEREREVSRESLVQREIVKVRCRNCGRLNLETSQACQNCGANI